MIGNTDAAERARNATCRARALDGSESRANNLPRIVAKGPRIGRAHRASSARAVGARGHSERRAAQRAAVDLKVLLVSADGTEPGYGAWRRRSIARACPTTRSSHSTASARRDADRRRPRRLRHESRQVPGRDPRHRRSRPHRHQSRRHDELPLGVHRRRMGGAREVRAHVRDPPAQRLHGSRAAAWPERRSAARSRTARSARSPPPARRRSPTSRARSRSPTTPRRSTRRSATWPRRSTRRTGRRSSPGRAAPAVPRHLHAPGGRARGDGR